MDSVQIHIAGRENSHRNLLFGRCTQYHQCSLALQTDKKDFSAISRAVSNCIKMLEEILTNKNTDLLKSFNSSRSDIVKKIDDYQMRLTLSGSTRKKRAEDTFSNDKDRFNETVIKPFVSALIAKMKWVFDMSDTPIVLALMRLDPISILEESDINEDVESLKTLHEFYGNVRTGEFGEHTTTCEKIINCNEESLVAKYKTFRQYITKDSQQKRESSESQVKNVKARVSKAKTNKYTTKNAIKKLNKELAEKERLVKFPITAESLLKDGVVEAALPSIRRLLKLCIIIPHSETVVERTFSGVGLIMTKKRCSKEDQSHDMLMRFSFFKDPLNIEDVKAIMHSWTQLKDRRIFSDDL